MLPPDLRKLKHALIVAETRSFARASQRLHLTQSALTRSIQALERELGLQLFDRGRRGVKPTRDGARVLQLARGLLLQARGLEREVELLKQAEHGEIAFGLGLAMSNLFLPDLLVQLNTDHPMLSVEVAVESPHLLLDMLANETIEFFVGDISQLPASALALFDIETLAEIIPEFFVRRDHPLAASPRVRFADMAPFTLISPQQGGRDKTAQTAATQSRIRCNDLPSLRRLVLESDAILSGIAPIVADDLSAGAIRPLKVVDLEAPPPCRIAYVTLAGRTPSHCCELLKPRLVQYFETPGKSAVSRGRSLVSSKTDDSLSPLLSG
ncbi:MAG TPA: LysR family transcriptional regulator [Porticoccaceae bacterium]